MDPEARRRLLNSQDRVRDIVSQVSLLARRRLRARSNTPHVETLVREGFVVTGPHSYGRPIIHVWRKADGTPHGEGVRIGAFVSMGEDVHIYTGGNHRVDWVTTYPLRHRFGLPGSDDYGHPASK